MRDDVFPALAGADLATVCGGHGPTTEQTLAQMTRLADSLTSMASTIDKKTQSTAQTLSMMSMLGR